MYMPYGLSVFDRESSILTGAGALEQCFGFEVGVGAPKQMTLQSANFRRK